MANHKIQFEFSDRALQRLNGLVGDTQAPSRADVVRHALQWFDWLVRLHQEGNTFYAKAPDGSVKELVFLEGVTVDRQADNQPT